MTSPQPATSGPTSPIEDSPILRPFRLIGRTVLAGFREIGRIATFSGRVLLACITPVIYLREVLRQCLKIGFFSLPVVGLTAVFIGAALALNIYTGGARFNAEQFVPNIVVVGITRELGPVLAALMLAGRVSAGIAAEIGAMRVTEQIDALLTLSAKPERYLYAPRVIAGILTLPLLVWIALSSGLRTVTVNLLLLLGFATWGLDHGAGPFVNACAPTESHPWPKPAQPAHSKTGQ